MLEQEPGGAGSHLQPEELFAGTRNAGMSATAVAELPQSAQQVPLAGKHVFTGQRLKRSSRLITAMAGVPASRLDQEGPDEDPALSVERWSCAVHQIDIWELVDRSHQ